MRNNLTTSNIFDVNKKTGGLILGKNRLDDYASKYLSRVRREALTTPMPYGRTNSADAFDRGRGLSVKKS